MAGTAAALTLLFERHVERRVVAQLGATVDQLAAGIDQTADGLFSIPAAPADPRLTQPYSGSYWQVEVGGQVLRSRSLWDAEIPLGPRPAAGVLASYDTDGLPSGEHLVVERVVTLPDRLGGSEARIAVALDRAEIEAATGAFRGDLLPYLLVLAAFLLGASFLQTTVGLRPLAAVRARLGEIKSGALVRLGRGYPDEVQPLVDEVDALLDASDLALRRARTRAADLAHSLKTPLQLLAGEIERLARRGDVKTAEDVSVVWSTIGAAVDRELARAIAVPTTRDRRAAVADAVERVFRVVRRTPKGDRLALSADIGAGIEAAVEMETLVEALGSIIENAARYARSAVSVSARIGDGDVVIVTRDDGDGIAEDRLPDLARRGVRIDQAGPGHGLGLAIVADIAADSRGSLAFRNADPGLEVTLRLPPFRRPG
jgi:signal transduction histidine kinase